MVRDNVQFIHSLPTSITRVDGAQLPSCKGGAVTSATLPNLGLNSYSATTDIKSTTNLIKYPEQTTIPIKSLTS